MRLLKIALLASLVALSACGKVRESKLNPFNWFGNSRQVQTVSVEAAPTDKRLFVDTVLSMQVEQIATGAIIRATGLPPTQGYWDAELVPLPLDENGRLVLEFRIFPPVTPAGVVNQQSREVTVALALSNIKLAPVREIIVQGAQNARSSRR